MSCRVAFFMLIRSLFFILYNLSQTFYLFITTTFRNGRKFSVPHSLSFLSGFLSLPLLFVGLHVPPSYFCWGSCPYPFFVGPPYLSLPLLVRSPEAAKGLLQNENMEPLGIAGMRGKIKLRPAKQKHNSQRDMSSLYFVKEEKQC